MPARRWANQDAYASAIESHAGDNGVPIELAYGLIAQESGFNATAIRQEPNYKCASTGVTGDASYGLVQVLYCTARGMGYAGAPAGLFDVDTNVQLGMTLLGQLLQSHAGDVGAALSAYNGGDRHSIGYGARRADGTFANQKYVDNILNNAAYFSSYLAERDAPPVDGVDASSNVDGSSNAGDSSTASTIAGAIAVVGAAWALARVIRG